MVEHRIDVPGGRIWAETVGVGDATPLLLLHGGPGVPSAYLDSLRALADERPVILYDQLGCGRSERPAADTGVYLKERFVEEVAAVRTALGLREIHLFGQSWGGMLAVLYALTKPAGVHSVILASPVIDVPTWVADCAALKQQLPVDVLDTLDRHEASGYTSCPEYAAANLEWWRRHVCRTRPFPDEVERALAGMGIECYETMWGPSEFTCTGNLNGLTLSHRLAEIDAPMLFTCGRHDEARPDTLTGMAAPVSADVVVFEDSAHMAHLEERDAYLACIRAFLAGIGD